MGELIRITAPARTEVETLAALHPELRAWFKRRFGSLAPAQVLAVPEILAGNSILLSSPTGSGKTLAAFLGVFDYLAKARDRDALPAGVVAIYLSPLRALAYDLRKNLQQPLDELGWDWLRIGARTGDTTAKERAQQRRKPPHILVTTPESLTLLVSQSGWLTALRTTRFMIIDELHSLAENKRGSLALVAAERQEELAQNRKPETGNRKVQTRSRGPLPSRSSVSGFRFPPTAAHSVPSPPPRIRGPSPTRGRPRT